MKLFIDDNEAMLQFFYNEPNAGTAGVWRIAAINEAGGWKDRTTVEDMDLAVRASLKGWKFVYLGDLQVCLKLPICTCTLHIMCIFGHSFISFLSTLVT